MLFLPVRENRPRGLPQARELATMGLLIAKLKGGFSMLAKILSSAVLGIDGYIVEVEVDIAGGLPSFSTVGLHEGAVWESSVVAFFLY